MSLTTLFAIVLLPVLLALTGLVAKGGYVLVGPRQVQGRERGARGPRLSSTPRQPGRIRAGRRPSNPRAAERAAAEYIAVQDAGLAATVRVDPQQVVVHVTSRAIPMTLLRIAGIMQVQVEADASAEPRTGVTSAQR